MDKEEQFTMFQGLCEKLNINHNLIMLKITLFVTYAASSSLIPFLTIHMQSVGITVEEIAVTYLALPLTTFLAPPITGFLVDKSGHFKSVLFVSLLLNAVFHHALMFIPQVEAPGNVPPAYVMRHPQNGLVEVWWSPCPSRECPEREELNLVVDKCEDYCMVQNSQRPKNWRLSKIEQSIAVRPPTLVGVSNSYVPMQGCLGGLPPEAPDLLNVPEDPTAPNPDLHFILQSKHKNSTKKGSTTPVRKTKLQEQQPHVKNNSVTTKPDETVFLVLEMHGNLQDAVENLGIELPESEDSSEVTDFTKNFPPEIFKGTGVNFSSLLEEDLRCGGRIVATNLTYKKLNELAADCMLQRCVFRSGGPEICPPDYKESDDTIFWIYFALRFVGTAMASACVTVIDPIALLLVQKYGGEFGRERLFSTIGMAIFSPLTGILIDYKTTKQGYTDFSYAFYIYDLLLVISMITVWYMPMGVKMPVDNIIKHMFKLVRLPHIIAFLFFMFSLGNCWGFIESYLFLHLKELGASNYLLGITVTVATISSIPFLYGAEKITNKIGHVNVIVLAFLSHAIRLVGYSFIDDPWWVVPFEALEAIAVHLMWVAAATYCTVIAPKNLLTTLMGILGMIHFSLGKGSGSFIGGYLIRQYGTRQSFRIMGLIGFITGALYSLLHCIFLSKYESLYQEEVTSDILECEKLNNVIDVEKLEKPKESKEECEGLSLIIKLNHRGSIGSLDRMPCRCQSYSIELNEYNDANGHIKFTLSDKSFTKLGSLKSAIELNQVKNSSSSVNSHKLSTPQIQQTDSKENVENNQVNAMLGRKGHCTFTCSAQNCQGNKTSSDSIPEESESLQTAEKENPQIKINTTDFQCNGYKETN